MGCAASTSTRISMSLSPIQSALLPARLVRNHARARLAPSPDELLGHRRARQSPQRRADSPAPAAAPKDCDRHAGRRTKTSRKTRTQARLGSDPPALDFDLTWDNGMSHQALLARVETSDCI